MQSRTWASLSRSRSNLKSSGLREIMLLSFRLRALEFSPQTAALLRINDATLALSDPRAPEACLQPGVGRDKTIAQALIRYIRPR